MCKWCLKKYHKHHYRKNKILYMARSQAYRARVYAEINKLKARPCTDCHNSFPPCVMDFDHLGKKIMNVAKMVHDCVSMARILAEIKKCELVCANCHRIRTHRRHTSRMSSREGLRLQPG